jgi:hypothetical protein
MIGKKRALKQKCETGSSEQSVKSVIAITYKQALRGLFVTGTSEVANAASHLAER